MRPVVMAALLMGCAPTSVPTEVPNTPTRTERRPTTQTTVDTPLIEACFAAPLFDAEPDPPVVIPPDEEACFASKFVPVEVCEFQRIDGYFLEGRLVIAGPLYRELALRAPNTESGADAADRFASSAARVIRTHPARRADCMVELNSLLSTVIPVVCSSTIPNAKERCERLHLAVQSAY
jgi:hypothetical protein